LAPNLDVFDFSLSDEEMVVVNEMHKGERGAVDSDTTGL
jgi:hypothetical protein